MGYPVIADTNTSTDTSGTTHTVSLPPNIGPGDLLLIFITVDGDTSITGWNGFTELGDDSNTTVTFAVGYKIADGTEGSTIDITSADAGASSHVTYRITGAAGSITPELSTVAKYNDQFPDPSTCTPTGGAKQYLWIHAAGWETNKTVSAWNGDYTLERTSSVGTDCGTAVSGRYRNASSENPGSITISGDDQWVAWCIAIHPGQDNRSWWFEKADSEINFTNTSYNEKHRLDFVAPESGDYLILVSFNARVGTSAFFYYRTQLDDSTDIMTGQYYCGGWAATIDYKQMAAFYLAESLSAGSHHVDIDAYVSTGTGYMRYMKITVVRLDDWLPTTGMYDYAAGPASQEIEDSWETVATLTFTPDVAGDYLILGCAGIKPESASENLNVRLNYDSGTEYIPVDSTEESGDNYLGFEAYSADDVEYLVWGGIVNIPVSSKTILLEAISTSATDGIIYNGRVIAIRIGAMDSSANTDEDVSNVSTSSQWADRSIVSFTPPSSEDYWILSGICIKPNATGTSNAGDARLNKTAGTNSRVMGETDVQSKQLGPADIRSVFVSEVESLSNELNTYKTQYGYGDGSSSTHYSKGSFIVIIRKPDPPECDPWLCTRFDTLTDIESTSFLELGTVPFIAPAQGDYLIFVTGLPVIDSSAYSIEMRAQLDDTTTFLSARYEPVLGNNDEHNVSAFYVAEDLAAGKHYVDVDGLVSGGTGLVAQLTVTIIRLDLLMPTTGMYAYTNTETEATLTTGWATYETLTFTPDQAGNYLVLGTAAWKAGDTTKWAAVRLNYDSGSEYLPIESTGGGTDCFLTRTPKNATEYKHQFWGGIISLPASSKTILLEGKSNTTTTPKIKYRRIIAIRIGALDPSANSDEDVTETSTTSTSDVTKSTTNFTPGSAEDYLIIGSICVAGDSINCRVDGSVEETLYDPWTFACVDDYFIRGSSPYCSQAVSLAMIKNLPAASHTFETQYASYNVSYNAYARSSFILAIRKPPDETTAYKDVPVKASILSADTYKDVPVKASISYLYSLTGITKDSDGNVLGSCQCFLVKDNQDNTFTFVAHVVSNAVTGVYTFTGIVDNDAQYQVIAWKDDTPHVFDVTDWVLQPQ